MISPESLMTRPTRVAQRVTPVARHALLEPTYDSRVVRQFRRVAAAVMKEFPVATGGTILFSGVGSSQHVAHVATQVAQQLALQPDAAVVLVDGDAVAQRLTEQLDQSGKPGLAEVLLRRVPLHTTMVAMAENNVHVIPFGDRRVARNPISSDAVKTLMNELDQLYRYRIIVAGTAANSLHAMLSRHSDGTYLIAQLGAARRQDTSDLANYLTRAGARLLGCIATSSV